MKHQQTFWLFPNYTFRKKYPIRYIVPFYNYVDFAVPAMTIAIILTELVMPQ